MLQIGMLVRDRKTDELYKLVDVSKEWRRFFVIDQSGLFKVVDVKKVVAVDKPMPDKKPERKKEKKQIRDFVEGKKFS